MFSRKEFGNKKVVKGFTLVEIIVVLVILAILAATTIPSLLGFIDDAKFKTIDNEARVVRNAAQTYATEQSAKGESDEDIQNVINGVINSGHALHNLLQNDANGTVFETKVENGKIRKFKYTKEIIDTNEDIITDKIRYAVFDDEKTSLLHATGSVPTIDIEDFEAKMIAKVTAALTSNDPESLKSSLTTNLDSSLESGMNSKISALKTNFRTELGSNVVDLVYPVGSYYVSHSSTSPATLFSGTTWTQVENKCLYCMAAGANVKKPEDSSKNLVVGDTGGEATHTLTVNEMPSHKHDFIRGLAWDWGDSGATESSAQVTSGFSGGTALTTRNSDSYRVKNVGGGQAHNNMPPYIAVYCWRRTA